MCQHSQSTGKPFGLGLSPILSLIKIISDKVLFNYIVVNFLYDLPFIGKRLFYKRSKKIVPS